MSADVARIKADKDIFDRIGDRSAHYAGADVSCIAGLSQYRTQAHHQFGSYQLPSMYLSA
jgi:hypothetical protein